MRWLSCLEEVESPPHVYTSQGNHQDEDQEEEEETTPSAFHGRIGSREGHCAAVVTAIPPAATIAAEDYVVLLGGYCEGELCSQVLAAPVAAVRPSPGAQPVLRWEVVPLGSCSDDDTVAPCSIARTTTAESDEATFRCIEDGEEAAAIVACDGATLTSVPLTALPSCFHHPKDTAAAAAAPSAAAPAISAALLFGGLNSDLDRTNHVYILTLHVQERSAREGTAHPRLSFTLHEWHTTATGDALPPPCSRHSAGLNTNRDGEVTESPPLSLFVFGGETDAAEQTNHLYQLHLATGAWSEVRTRAAHAPWPSPRHLANSSLCYLPWWDCFVLYGGAHYVAGNIQSFADVWLYHVAAQTWRCLVDGTAAAAAAGGPSVTLQDRLPPCNGHSGVVVPRYTERGGPLRWRGADVCFVGGKESAVGEDRVKRLRFTLDLSAPSRPAPPLVDCQCVCALVEAEASQLYSVQGAEEDTVETDGAEEPALSRGHPGTPHWRYMPAVVPLPLPPADRESGEAQLVLLLLGGQCRHEQADAAFALFA